MKSVLLWLLLFIPFTLFAQQTVAPLDSSRTTFTIFLKDGGQYVGRIVERDAIKVVVRRQGGGLSYLAPADITRIEPYQPKVRTRGRDKVNITMTDGTVYTGEIREQDSTRVILRRRGGESILSPKEITKIEPVSDETGNLPTTSAGLTTPSASQDEDNQFPWLLYNQTAIPLKGGQLAYRNIWLLYNEISFGLLNFLTLRASVTPSYSGTFFADNTIYTRPALGAKLSLPLKNVVFGVDYTHRWTQRTEYYWGPVRPRNEQIQVWTGFVTIGSLQRNFTLGYSNLRSSTTGVLPRNSIDIGFVTSIGRRLSFVSDNRFLLNKANYRYDYRFSQVSGVVRINRPRHAFDLGVLVAIRDENMLRFFPLPYLAFNTRLGRK